MKQVERRKPKRKKKKKKNGLLRNGKRKFRKLYFGYLTVREKKYLQYRHNI